LSGEEKSVKIEGFLGVTAAAVGFSHKLVINQSRRVEIEQERERKKSGI
jgi:hypothetical protein